MEQHTLKLDDGTIVYCYEDGSIECYDRKHKRLYKTFGTKDNHGYFKIKINQKDYRVHRLIALAFIPNPSNYLEIDHINRNKLDNRTCNLRWCSRRSNLANRTIVDKAIVRDGFRKCENKNRYHKLHSINVMKPNGNNSSIYISEEERKILTPLTQKERYFKLKEIRDTVKD